VVDDSPRDAATALALHGFTLGGAMFAGVGDQFCGELISPDLPGHGGRDATDTDWGAAVTVVCRLAEELRPDVVLGYSMGGRLALAAALRAPQLFSRLVLVSTSPGIADQAARANRRAADDTLAAAIETEGVAAFVERWGRRPLLRVPNDPQALVAIRNANTAAGLAGALRGMGQGSQPFLGGRLGRLEMPVVWVAGDRDLGYAALAKTGAASCRNGRCVITHSGHNVVAEHPKALASLLNGYDGMEGAGLCEPT